MAIQTGNSTPVLANYTFLPWLRQGLSNRIPDSATNAIERYALPLKVNVKGKNGDILQTVPVDINMVGPGDIVGLSESAIARTHPENWVTNFEAHHLPFIEFYEEDFPWRYTPAPPEGSQLTPWLYLLVVRADEFVRRDPLAGPLPSISLLNGVDPFAPFDQTWGWAHVHLNGDLFTESGQDLENEGDIQDAMERLRTLLQHNPDVAVSRLLSPRKLEENTEYHAFLIPSFETGRLAGLGLETTGIQALEGAWGSGQTDYPIYHESFFKTGAAGDFEHLVRQIIPRQIDPSVGVQRLDIQNPGYELNYAGGTDEHTGTIGFASALRVPTTESEPYSPLTGDWLDFISQIEDLVNMGDGLLNASFPSSYPYTEEGFEDDPVVSPPLYGRWHALKRTVNKSSLDWINELNLDPRNRAAAGIGTKIIQDNQDKFMDVAWDQLGEVQEANRLINLAQIAKEINERLYTRHLLPLSGVSFNQIMADLQSALLYDPDQTVYAATKESALPAASLSSATRKIQRPRGPIMKRAYQARPDNRGVEQIASIASREWVGGLSDARIKTQPDITASDHQARIQVTEAASLISDALAASLPGNDTFTVTSPKTTETTDISAEKFQEAIGALDQYFDAQTWTGKVLGAEMDLGNTKTVVAGHLNPLSRIPRMVIGQLSLCNFQNVVITPTLSAEADKIIPIMAHPVFPQPMYEYLKDLSMDYFISNLDKIPQNTIALLETNPNFIESFFVGLNQEMSRELLWREYPTDQRGTFFRQFWDTADSIRTGQDSDSDFSDRLQDIDFIHNWPSNTELGTHDYLTDPEDDAKVVLVFRGDLFKKFPNAMLYAVKGEYPSQDSAELAMVKPIGPASYPLFTARIEPDILFVGFNFSVDEAIGRDEEGNITEPGYFFVLKERAGDLNFGLDLAPDDYDESSTPAPDSWSDFHWGFFESHGRLDLDTEIQPSDETLGDYSSPDGKWSDESNAADVATILYQPPFMVSIHAREMLNPDM